MTSTVRSRALAFVNRVAKLRFENAFNPYADECPECDAPRAAATRRRNLQLVLECAIRTGVQSLWIARDLGYRGGRRTGLALTDEVHLAMHAGLYGGLALARATRGPAVGERTASIIWQVLRRIDQPVFLWNVFPLHPHERGDPMSNRCHTRQERQMCGPLLTWLLDSLSPKLIVAIGRDAQLALDDMGVNAEQVRHPSYGGQSEFVAGAQALYGVTCPANTTAPQLF